MKVIRWRPAATDGSSGLSPIALLGTRHARQLQLGGRSKTEAIHEIVVIGGTGLIGSKTIAILRSRGHEVVAAAPNTGNTITSEGRKESISTFAGLDSFAASGRGYDGAAVRGTLSRMSNLWF